MDKLSSSQANSEIPNVVTIDTSEVKKKNKSREKAKITNTPRKNLNEESQDLSHQDSLFPNIQSPKKDSFVFNPESTQSKPNEVMNKCALF